MSETALPRRGQGRATNDKNEGPQVCIRSNETPGRVQIVNASHWHFFGIVTRRASQRSIRNARLARPTGHYVSTKVWLQ